MNLEENIKIMSYYNKLEEVELDKLNLSCPNIVGKPQTGYSFEDKKKVLTN